MPATNRFPWLDGGTVGPFALDLTFGPGRVDVMVRGDVDSYAGPELAAVLAGISECSNRSVVLDLAECNFIDPAGLWVIADSTELLAIWGRTLSVRSPSSVVRRLLDLVSSTGLIVLDDQVSSAGPSAPSPASVDRDRVDGSLGVVVALARALVGGADGASVSLRRHGRLATVGPAMRPSWPWTWISTQQGRAHA